MGLTIPKMQCVTAGMIAASSITPKHFAVPGNQYTSIQFCFYCGTEGSGQCRNCGAAQKVSKTMRVAEGLGPSIDSGLSHLLRPITRTFGGVADEFIIRQDDECIVYGIHQGEMILPTRWLTRTSSLPQRSKS